MFSFEKLFKQDGSIAKPLRKDEGRNFRIPLIGEQAPSFITESTAGSINFPSDYGSNWKVILSHPMDFTPVCSTELIEMANLQEEFEKLHGMIHLETDNNRDVRGVFIIDPDNKIRAEFFYPQEVGRNMNELLRTVIALQTTERYNVLTPANWKTGYDVLVPFPLKANMSDMNNDSGEYYQFSWFLIFKKGINGSLK